jgi:hypothetical protein
MTSSLGPVGRLFSQDKVINSRVLNMLGAQVLRTVAARAVYNLRRVPVADLVNHEVAELKRDGIVVLRDFLPVDHFERVRAECAWLDGQRAQITTSRRGPTIVDEIAIARFPEQLLPSTYEFYDHPRLRGIVAASEQRPMTRLALSGEREYVTHGPPGGEMDPETELHSDIFFNTHKAWFYLDDVQTADGPLVYVKGSHRATPARLSFVYRDSWTRDPASNPSRRISSEEQRRLEVQETVVTCPANTLVVINASGYHRRLQGQQGRTRRALHLSLRANPFAPHGLHSTIARYPAVYAVLRRAKKTIWRA